LETLDAIKDHNEIRDTIAEVARHEVGTPDWHKAIAVVNRANGDHMAEEESEGLTDFRQTAMRAASRSRSRHLRARSRAVSADGPRGR
jgi:hypothetical protein